MLYQVCEGERDFKKIAFRSLTAQDCWQFINLRLQSPSPLVRKKARKYWVEDQFGEKVFQAKKTG